MAKEDYDRGVRDGKNNSTAGYPVKGGVIKEGLGFYTDKELESIKDWKQGYEHGKKQR